MLNNRVEGLKSLQGSATQRFDQRQGKIESMGFGANLKNTITPYAKDAYGKTSSFVGKVTGHLGAMQTGLVALSVAANSLPKEFESLNNNIQGAVVGLSTLSALSGIVPILSNKMGILGVAVAGLTYAIYNIEKTRKRGQEIQEKGDKDSQGIIEKQKKKERRILLI